MSKVITTLELTVRDFALTAVEAGLYALSVDVAGGNFTRASLVAAGVLAVRTFAGLVANALKAHQA
jgi:hypothetical protein